MSESGGERTRGLENAPCRRPWSWSCRRWRWERWERRRWPSPPPCRGERERVRGRARARAGGGGHNVSGRRTLLAALTGRVIVVVVVGGGGDGNSLPHPLLPGRAREGGRLSPPHSCYNHWPPTFCVRIMSALIIPFQRCIYDLKAISISRAISSLPLSPSRAAAARAVRECGWRAAEARH